MTALLRGAIVTACSLLACGLALAVPSPSSPDDDLDSTAYDYPVVITPTRLRQSLAEVPASVTVITADMLRRYGITSIPDALRLVPGMAVTRSTGNDYRINYHGTGVVAPRRMNVMIDGFSAYGSELSRVDWGLLPVAIEDVDRIEVTRGPDSAAYGPNSMMSVINIITRRPKDVESGLVALGAGSRAEADATVRLAGRLSEATHLSLTANTSRDSGYDRSTIQGGAHDSTQVKRLNLRTQTRVDAQTTLDLDASHLDGHNDVAYASDSRARTYPDQHRIDSQLQARWTHALSAEHELQVRFQATSARDRQSWQTCWPRLFLHPVIKQITDANPELAAAIAHNGNMVSLLVNNPPSPEVTAQIMAAIASLGGWPAAMALSCGVTNNNVDETRTQIELQDTLVLNDAWRLVAGMGLRQQTATSEVYFQGTASNQVRWMFAHSEWRIRPELTINAGGYAESNSLGSDSFSPRLAANWRWSDTQSWRAVYSRGTRTPDLLETKVAWTPVMDNTTPTVLGASHVAPITLMRGNPDLHAERITSVEFGHLLAWRPWGLVVDTRVFKDRLRDLISSYSSTTQISPNNNTQVDLMGAETQASWDIDGRWSGWLSYAYLLNQHASNPVEHSQWSRHSGALGVSRALSDTQRVGLSHAYASGDGYLELPYARTDLTLTHHLRLDNKAALWSATLSYLHTASTSTYLGSVGSFQSTFNQRWSLQGRLRLSF